MKLSTRYMLIGIGALATLSLVDWARRGHFINGEVTAFLMGVVPNVTAAITIPKLEELYPQITQIYADYADLRRFTQITQIYADLRRLRRFTRMQTRLRLGGKRRNVVDT